LRSRIIGLLVLASLVPLLISNVAAPPQYSLSISPSSGIMNLGNTATLTFNVKGGAANTPYSVTIDVVKPNGSGTATANGNFVTDSRGIGSATFPYPSSSFIALNGTLATDALGVYTVSANVTAPGPPGIVATLQFIVSSQLTVVISRPTGGTIVRGTGVLITATVSDLNSRPVSRAIVSANTPTGNEIGLIETVPGSGVYEVSYDAQLSDPIGAWTTQVTAADLVGNSGLSNQVTVTIQTSTLVVEDFVAYDARGLPSTDFSPGDTIYPFFRIRYGTTGSSVQYLKDGQFKLSVISSSGIPIANLTAIYDYTRSGFSTPTGYAINQGDPVGSWLVIVPPGSLSDAYQNTGPSFQTSIRIQVHTGGSVSPTSYFAYLLGGAFTLLSGLVVFKKLGVAHVGSNYLRVLMDGPIPRSSSILVLGDSGSGKTVLAYRLLHDELEVGHLCTLLSYDAFPESVRARMAEFGWDITTYLKSGQLEIIDCYSGLTGDSGAQVKEPTDLTEVTIQVTGALNKAKGAPVSVFLDSLTPIFNGLEARQAISFIQTLGAKVKKTGGVFVVLASIGAVPDESIAKIKSTVDGIIELDVVRKGRKVTKYLSIMKMERRRVSSEAVPFDIDQKRGGLVFQVHRFRLWRRFLPSLSFDRTAAGKRSVSEKTLPESGSKGANHDGPSSPSPDNSPFGPAPP